MVVNRACFFTDSAHEERDQPGGARFPPAIPGSAQCDLARRLSQQQRMGRYQGERTEFLTGGHALRNLLICCETFGAYQ